MAINLTSTASPPLWRRLVFGRNPTRTLIRAAILIIAAFILFRFILLPVRVTGISMEPTYRDGKIDLINRLAYWRTPPKRGDVVAIRTSGFHVMNLKRIVGLPGETVAFKNGIVLIDGQPLEEPWVINRFPWQEPPRKLEPDQYFLVGDNRSMPQAQHKHLYASYKRIVGKVLW